MNPRENIGIQITEASDTKNLIINNLEPLGIPSLGYEYLRLLPHQNRKLEFNTTISFLLKVIKNEEIAEFQGEKRELQFINYGDTELVYVLNIDDKKYAILVNQPQTKFGIVKKEYDNLIILGKLFPNYIVTPFHYSKDDESHKELYVAPYLYQARCVGVCEHIWGEWIPEPDYHFRDYTNDERIVINSCMIALLIKFYNQEKNLGIGACKIGGGDFMLEKGYEKEKITQENILKRMKLIAAREFISISLDDYIKHIRDEFCKRTYYQTEEERDKSILINYKARGPMFPEDIQKGIELGLKLRESL